MAEEKKRVEIPKPAIAKNKKTVIVVDGPVNATCSANAVIRRK